MKPTRMILTIGTFILLAANKISGQSYPITGKTLVCKDEEVTISGPTHPYEVTSSWALIPLDGQVISAGDFTTSSQSDLGWTFVNKKLEGRYNILRYLEYCTKKSFGVCFASGSSMDILMVRFTYNLDSSKIIQAPESACSDVSSYIYYKKSNFASGQDFACVPSNAVTYGIDNGAAQVYTWNNAFGGNASVQMKPFYKETSGKVCYGETKSVNIAVSKIPATAATPSGPTSVCQGTISSQVITTAIDASTYQWEITPSSAGTILGTGSTGTINWNTNFSGNAQVRAKGINCGQGPWSAYKTIAIQAKPAQAIQPTGLTSVYSGNLNVSYTSTSSGATTIEYTIDPTNAGTISNSSNKGFVNFSQTYVGIATIYAQGKNCDYGPKSVGRTVTVNALPSTPNKPVGPTTICYGTVSTGYSIGSVSGATSYEWSVTPIASATITGTGQSATLSWANGQSGERRIKVRGVVSGNYGPWSDELVVTILPQVGQSAKPTGSMTSFCQGLTTSTYTTTGAINATIYQWDLSPTNIGNIVQDGTNITISWNTSVNGSAHLKVRGSNCTFGAWSDELIITINPLPNKPNKPSGISEVCQGTTSNVYQTDQVANATTYNWSIDPATAGSVIGGTTQATVYWNSTFTGLAKLKVRGQSCDFGDYSDELDILVQAIPIKASTPSGITTLCEGTETSFYTTSGATGAETYNWEIFPANAANLVQDDLSCSVYWTAGYSGNAMLKVRGVSCSEGLWSNNLIITVNPLPAKPTRPSGATTVCQGATNKTYSTSATQNASSYQWSIIPEIAGTITGTGTTANVNFNADFTDGAVIMVRALSCDYGPWSDEYQVTVNPKPGDIDILQAPQDLCQGVDNITINSSVSEAATQYNWTVTPSNAGTIAGVSNSATLNLNDTYYGNITIGVYGQNTCGVSATKQTVTNVIAKPGKAAIPIGDINICQGTASSDYVTEGAANASVYQWQISNESAGTLEYSGTNCTIHWNQTFTGPVSLRVKGITCADGIYSDYLNITVHENPSVPGTPTGISLVCTPAETNTFTINPTNAESYVWTIEPSGIGSITGSGTSAIVAWNNESSDTLAYIRVASAKEYCNNSQASNPKIVTLREKPTVTGGEYDSVYVDNPEFTLNVGRPAGGQYYLDGLELLNNRFNPAQRGIGVHNVDYTYTQNLCSNSANVRVEVINLNVKLVIGSSEMCLYESPINLNGGSPSGGTYSGNGVVSGKFYPAIAGAGHDKITYSYSSAGYTNYGYDTIIVLSAPNKPLITSDKEIYCKGSNALLQANGQGGDITWYKGETKIDEGNNIVVRNINETETITAFEKSIIGCFSEGKDFALNIDNITSDFDANKYSIMPEDKINFTNLSIGAATYKWNFGDGTNTSTLENPTHYYFNEGIYTVTLEVTSINSCKDTLKKQSYIVVSNNPNSINENSTILGLSVYPNPTTGILYINTGDYGADNNIEISLIDISGRIILKNTLSKQKLNEIDLSGIMPGNYMLSINVNGILGHKEIIVK